MGHNLKSAERATHYSPSSYAKHGSKEPDRLPTYSTELESIGEEMCYVECPVDTFLAMLPDPLRTRDPRVKQMLAPNYNELNEIFNPEYKGDKYHRFNKAMRSFVRRPWSFSSTSAYKMTEVPLRGANPSQAELFYDIKTEDHRALPKRCNKQKDERLGDIAVQINALQAVQHRNAVFHIYIVRKNCRLIHHTRAGTSVTKEFDITKEPYLHEFLWRFSHANQSDRGHDVTFTKVPSVRYDTRHRIEDRYSGKARERLGLSENAPLFKVDIGSEYEAPNAPSYVYVSQPIAGMPYYFSGRISRCYSAYDPVNDRIVLLKDAWRNRSTYSEHQIYLYLHDHGVPNILGVVAAGEINLYGHVSTTSLVHYRMVLDQVGLPFDACRSSRELISVLADAVEAHKAAYESAGVMHRDISIGNIIMIEDDSGPSGALRYKGVLIDWELSNRAGHDEPIGTRPFMSINMVSENPKERTPEDDLESFIYVALWMAAHKYSGNAEVISNVLSYSTDKGNPEDRRNMLRDDPVKAMDLRDEFLAPILETLTQRVVESNLIRDTARDEKSSGSQDPETKEDQGLQFGLSHNWLLETLRKALTGSEYASTQVTESSGTTAPQVISGSEFTNTGGSRKRKRDDTVEEGEVKRKRRTQGKGRR